MFPFHFLFRLLFVSSFFTTPLFVNAQTPQPLHPTGTIQTTAPKFSGVTSSLVPNVIYNVAVSETPRSGANNQYVNWWVKAGLSANDLLESNANRLMWNSSWEEKTRNGNPNGPATTVSANSPSALTPGKIYYWHIVGTNGYKSAQASFTVSNVPNQPILSVTPNLNRSLFEATWSSASNVSYYELQRNGATIYTGGALKQDVGIGSAGTTYTFTLKACNAVGCSAGHSVPGNFPVPPTSAIIQTPAIASTSSNIPSFAALASSLISNTTYTVVLSEAPRTGLNNQYIDYWSIGGLSSSDLLASNVNHVRWNTGWVKRTRYGNPDGPATILSNTSPATLTTGKTYYWQIVAFGANGGMSKSLEGRFTVANAISSSSNVSSSKSSVSSALSSSKSSSQSSVDIPYIKPLSPVTAVGSTPYAVDVDHKGEAVVSIPIQIAPGINGMHPQLSLTYNSGGTTEKAQLQTAGGLLSFGWGLTGISSIDRCTVGKPDVYDYIAPSDKSLGKQNMRPKLKYDDTDNLCLDGEQLVLVSGAHLRNGAQYRTYKESYRLITYKEFYDTDAKKNAVKFEVRNPNGSVAIYGGSESSRVQKLINPPHLLLFDFTPVFTWSITSETDSFGNEISYYYRKWESFSYQANKQRVFPTSIVYPGGTVNFGYAELNTYTAPGAPIGVDLQDDGAEAGPDRWRFNHDSGDQLTSIRTEARTYYVIGSEQTRTDLRLHGLKPSAIQECGSNTYMQYDQCLPPIKLEWLTRTTEYPEFPQVTNKYYEVSFLGNIVDSLGRKTEFQYDKIYGSYSTNERSKFLEFPLQLPATGSLNQGFYDRTHGNKDKDDTNEIGFVVIQLKQDTGVSSVPYILNYKYRAAGTVSSLGKGFLGFPAVRIEDPARQTVTYKVFELGKANYGPLGLLGEISAIHIYTKIYGTGEAPISKNEYRYSIKTLSHSNGAKTYLPIANQISNMSYEGATLVSTTIKTNEYEILNNQGQSVSKIISKTKVGARLLPLVHTPLYYCDNAPHVIDPASIKSEQITTTQLGSYSNASDWRIGFVSEKTNTSHNGAAGSNHATDVKTSRTIYSLKPGTMLVESETHFPGDTENEKTISYTYNAKGQQESVTVSGKNVESRTTQMLDYLPGHTFPQKTLNPLGHQTLVSDIDIRYKLPRKVTDANGLSVTTTLDAFSRPVVVMDKYGVNTTTSFNSCAVNYCATVAGKFQSITPVYYIEQSSPITPRVREYFDSLGRVIRTEQQGFANETVFVDVQFDEFGHVYKTSMPYTSNQTPYYETRIYDNRLNRIESVTQPDLSAVVTNYTTETIAANEPWLKVTNIQTVKSTNGLSLSARKKVSYFNSKSHLVRVVDAEGSTQAVTTQYEYDAFGNISKTIVNGGIDGVTTNSAIYDSAGNQISVTDPNTGTIIYRYTALGQPRLITDAEGKTTTYHFDKLGRIDLRNSDDGIFNWYYDNPGAKGMLAYEHDNKGYGKAYTYVNARLDNIKTTINITGQPARSFTDSFKYDSYGRLEKTTAPSGFAVTHRFNQYGYTSGFSYGDNLYSLWEINKQGAFGIEEETLIGAKTIKTFDPKSGRLESLKANQGAIKYQDLRYYWYSNASLERRDNILKNVSDVFEYDNHDRLSNTNTKNTDTWLNRRTISQEYSNLGNIKSNISNNSTDASSNNYQYGATANAGPHAVSSVVIGGISYQLRYNLNGAITEYDAPGSDNDKFISYNTNNQPVNITLGSSMSDANPRAREEFRYAVDGSLCYKKSTYNQSGALRTEHTYYVGNYEVTFYDSSAPILKSEKTKVGRLLVTHNTPQSGAKTETLQAVHLDYQGSIDAISNSTNLTLMAFEPFGSRRNTDLLSNISALQLNELLGKQNQLTADGYTGHKMLDRTGFIHMNGRVYDPALGRFLSPDPLVQSPSNSQSWNRYSYVFNNPMKYTDPSGYEAVEEVEVTPRDGCDEVCQRKGYTSWYYTNIRAIDTANARWENWGGRAYNVASGQGALLYQMAQGMAISNASIQAAVAGGGSKTNGNNILGQLSTTQQVGPQFDTNDPNYHEYSLRTQICHTMSAACTPENVYAALKRFPAPGYDGSTSIENGQVADVPFLGHVSHLVVDAQMTVVNITLGDHLLYPGKVVRSVVVKGPKIYVNTYGDGTGNLGTLNEAFDIFVWQPVDFKIRGAIYNP